jgi:hypothetical protein
MCRPHEKLLWGQSNLTLTTCLSNGAKSVGHLTQSLCDIFLDLISWIAGDCLTGECSLQALASGPSLL